MPAQKGDARLLHRRLALPPIYMPQGTITLSIEHPAHTEAAQTVERHMFGISKTRRVIKVPGIVKDD
ncbi:MAG: hypothetical protein KGK00_08585 [Paracoccaceae bacterium]|nr:hypothetical protein [Paracoccaceae bacterium]